MKDDTISRAAALDALDKVAEMFPYRIPGKAKTYRQYNEAWSDAIDAAENALEALPSAQPTCTNFVPVADCISRKAAIEAVGSMLRRKFGIGGDLAEITLSGLPPAQPNLSEAYSKAVFTWLMDYQIRAAELKGRYTPYEVLSWVINDWRKEHERSD